MPLYEAKVGSADAVTSGGGVINKAIIWEVLPLVESALQMDLPTPSETTK